ncbi:MAG: thiamine biosynthesis protein ThiJ [Candidatus Electrothrix sp. AX2]|nr:thiamine biosynthesis protein ThiJ [Candidatus Electrothrix gigas]
MSANKGKIGVLIEEHFDPTEYLRFNEYFPKQGYQVEYLSHLWGNTELRFGSNPEGEKVDHFVTVSTEVNDVNLLDYKGILLIGGYAMDRLRYESKPMPGESNKAPAVEFLRRAMDPVNQGKLKIGTICHSLWLFCAAPELIRGRKVTCAHNIICDMVNAGAEVVYGDEGTTNLVIDGGLITGKHPGMVDEFMVAFVQELEKM